MSPSRRRILLLASGLLLVLTGLGARLAYAPQILGPGGPHLIPTDSHYYLRFAQLQDGAFPAFRRFDPLVNFPTGAEILWPPIHTWLVRATILALGQPGSPETGAVWVGPLCFLLWVLLLGALTRRWHGAAASLWMIAALCLPPLAARAGDLGQLDHHVHEGPWIALILLLAHRLSLRPGARAAIALGVALAVGRLLTTSGFLGVPVAALALLLAALLRRREGLFPEPQAWRFGALAAAVATALQLLSAWAWGAPGSLDYTQLGAFHPLWTITCFAGALGLAALLDGPGLRLRAAASLAIALVSGATILLALRAGLGDAMRADAVLSAASESRPLWGDPMGAMSLLGQGWLFWGIAGLWAARGVSDDPALSRSLRLALSLTVPLLLISVVQVRLTRLGLGAMAFAVALALPPLVRHLSARVRPLLLGAAGGLALLSSLALLVPRGRIVEYEERSLRPSLIWLAQHTPGIGPEPTWSVLSTWTFGHLITAWGGRAAIATPFSQAAVHVAGNARALDILSEHDDARAFEKARAQAVRYVLAAPYRGTVGPNEQEAGSLMARLLEVAGMPPDAESSSHFRLVHESLEDRDRDEGGPLARIFEVVDGAELALSGPPDGVVTVRLGLRSARGESLAYRRSITLDGSGSATLRVPYPTEADPNATVIAEGPYQLELDAPDGTTKSAGEPSKRGTWATVSADAVRAGQRLVIALDPAPRTAVQAH